ncbi:hypothetical protein C2S51_001055 [Perilla frutescens var. frutescens]|nr:hypothetical protein C2S51_001055 [Perilla frutescens var. frutescens]
MLENFSWHWEGAFNSRCHCTWMSPASFGARVLRDKVIKSKSLIDYRPLCAVLLSDLLIVSATLALLSQGKESEKQVKLEADVKLLEWGLILHQTIRAVFIDCSLYLAIVICGLSFTL